MSLIRVKGLYLLSMSKLESLALKLPLIEPLPEALGRKVVETGFSKQLPKGSVIFQEGEKADGLWALLDGRIKLVRTSVDGRELLVHLVEAGQTFAEAALFQNAQYPVTAMTLKASRLWHWPRRRLIALLESSPELGLALLASAAAWNRKVVSQLQMLTQRRVEERLAIYIIGRFEGSEIVSGTELSLDMPKKLIAQLLGMAPEVFSRSLRKLEDAGVVETCGSGLRVLRPKLLQDLARGMMQLS